MRVIYHEACRRRATIDAQRPGSTAVADFVQQVGYREYSRYLSYHFPFTHERSLLEHVRAVPWVNCPLRYKAWRQGHTGYPVVDAAMRQLWATGWIHNRARVFTASFMVKNLLLPWQWGLKHFWDMLLDADLECDALGWQFVAGCLLDAKPFSYMMCIERESKCFDPNGVLQAAYPARAAQSGSDYLTLVLLWCSILLRCTSSEEHDLHTAPFDLLCKTSSWCMQVRSSSSGFQSSRTCHSSSSTSLGRRHWRC